MVPLIKPINALFEQIHAGHASAFDELFVSYYQRLVAFAQQYVKNHEAAEEITAAVLTKLWLKRHTLNNVTNPEVYLYVAVKNAALNHLRSVKNKSLLLFDDAGFSDQQHSHRQEHEATGHEQKELQDVIRNAINALPVQRRLIFIMIKEDGLRCQEVADILNISKRTVESQLYKAVKFLADRLSSYLGYHPQKRNTRRFLLLLYSF